MLTATYYAARLLCRVKTAHVLSVNEMLEERFPDIVRDWGFAPEYVDAMWRMLQLDQADDFVIATGRSASLQDFVQMAFENLDLDWSEHVISDQRFFRPSDIGWSGGNPERARKILHWEAKTTLPELVKLMLDAGRSGLDVSAPGKLTGAP